jgi:glycyl-tRNA synthetase
MAVDVTMEKIVSLARRRGFVFPSSEIYGGLGSSYDYGHYGVLLKDNVKARWLEAMVRERDDIVALDSSIILHPKVWEASGHVSGFTDPLIDCRTCKKRFRADQLADAECGRKPSKHPGETPECDLTEPRQFNLMFRTRVGAVEETGLDVYLRPETAQGIFVNFKNVAQLARRKPPFGIAQIGKAFRNEITPGNFIFRTLEFEMMELEYFVPPTESAAWHEYWVAERLAWHVRYGVREENLRARAHEADELSHYSSATSDIEYRYPIGWSELEGIANRGDYDLTQHTDASGTKLEWVDSGTGERFVPHVVEPSLGLNRSMLTFMIDAYDEEVVAERERTVLRLHPRLAPVTAAVLPLITKDSTMVEKAQALRDELRRHVSVEYDDSGQIGRRYRRQDEIGTPWALTIDEQTRSDDTVTLRDRDTLAQERIPIAGALPHLLERLAAPWSPPARSD